MSAARVTRCFDCADTGIQSRVPVGPRERRAYQFVPCTCSKGRVFAAAERDLAETQEPALAPVARVSPPRVGAPEVGASAGAPLAEPRCHHSCELMCSVFEAEGLPCALKQNGATT